MTVEYVQAPGPVMVPHAPDHGFSVTSSGGPTQVNLAWEQLLSATSSLGEATHISGEQLTAVQSAAGQLATVPLPLHWRIPLFATRMGLLSIRMLAVKEAVEQGRSAVDAAHEVYRGAEGAAQRWMDLGVLVDDAGFVLQNLAGAPLGTGDPWVAYDWAAAVTVLGGGMLHQHAGGAWPLIRMGQQLGQDTLAQEELENHELRLGEQTTAFEHQGDQSIQHYYREMGQVSAEGDVAVTVTEDAAGEPVYMVYLPGLDADPTDLNREDGRGYLGYLDAALNDSDQLAGVIDQALAEVGADPGAAVALSGYSLGGIGATNLAANRTLQGRYDLRAVNTIGAAGQARTLPTGTSVVHLQDSRDPINHVLGQAHQESSDRLAITYDFHNEDIGWAGVFGGAHDYGHHLEAIGRLEETPQEYLSPEEQAMLTDFGQLYSGEAHTHVFSADWEQASAEASTSAEAPAETEVVASAETEAVG